MKAADLYYQLGLAKRNLSSTASAFARVVTPDGSELDITAVEVDFATGDLKIKTKPKSKTSTQKEIESYHAKHRRQSN